MPRGSSTSTDPFGALRTSLKEASQRMGPKRNQVEEPLRQKASQSTFELGRLHCFNFLTFDVPALQFARKKTTATKQFGTGGRDEEDPFCSRSGHNRCGSRVGNAPRRTEQERDCRLNPGQSTVVHALILHRRQTASEVAWRLQQRRHLDRSS